MKGIKINWKAIPDAFKVVGKYGKEHAPSILVGLGIIGLGATVYFTADAAPKAKSRIDYENDLRSENGEEELKLIDKVKIAAPYYIPAGASAVFTVGCNVAAQKINLSRLSSLGVMYAVARNDLKEIKDKIIETDGQKKMDEINHSIANDVREKTNCDDIYDTGRGDTIFIDKFLHKTFKASPTVINNALTEMNSRLMVDGEYELSEFLYAMHLPWSDCEAARMAVFRANTATDIIHSYQICDWGPLGQEQSPVCVINYSQYLCPSYDFDARMNRYE